MAFVSDRFWLFAYLGAVVAVTLVHDVTWLAIVLGVAVIASGRERVRLLRRSVSSIVLFNLTVSLGYWLVASWRGDFRADYLLLVNLRVLLLVYLGIWLASRINLPKALGFAPTLAFLATLAAGQILGFRKMLADFRLAFRSRNLTKPTLSDRRRLVAVQGQYLLDKSLQSATEIGQAMRSRGCFDD